MGGPASVSVNGAQAALTVAPPAMYITLGVGKKNPRGCRRRVDSTSALAQVLREHGGPDVAHAWWSPHTWTGDSRDKEEQEAACAVVLDLDTEGHAQLAPVVAARLDEAARGGALPGSIFHRTPAGARLVLMLDGPCDDRGSYKRAARGVAGAVAVRLRELGIPLCVDPVVGEDLARLLYAPSCAAKGKRRKAEVIVLREEPYTLAVLNGWADKYPIVESVQENKLQPSREGAPDDVVSSFQTRGLYKRNLGGGKHDITCPWVKAHGGASDAGTVYFEPSSANGGAGGFKCQHAHCAGRNINDLRRHLGLASGSHARAPAVESGAVCVRDPSVIETASGIELGGIKLVRASVVLDERVEWLVPGFVARSELTDLSGDPGVGKGCITASWAARVTQTGDKTALLFGTEDRLGHVMARVRAEGADLRRVYLLDIREANTSPILPGDIALVEAIVKKTRAALAVFDPALARVYQPREHTWKKASPGAGFRVLWRMTYEARRCWRPSASQRARCSSSIAESIVRAKGPFACGGAG